MDGARPSSVLSFTLTLTAGSKKVEGIYGFWPFCEVSVAMLEVTLLSCCLRQLSRSLRLCVWVCRDLRLAAEKSLAERRELARGN